VATVTDDVTRPFDPRPGGTRSPDAPLTPGPPASSAPDLRGGLARLSRGLIAYGIIALVVAGLGLAVLLYVNTRIDAAGERVEASVSQLTTTLDRTAKALHDASTTAQTFNVTLDRTQEAVSAAANTIIGVRTNLETLESVLRAVNILGVSPLGPAADAVGGIANSIEGLDSRLTAIADGLVANRDSLAANATSLGQLGDSTAAMAERLRSGVVEDSLADVHFAIVVMLLVLTAWTMVPAVGALAFGVWLRRQLEAARG
jgi:ABC-type transporter Mla subunit MlaD